jgi:hypothetical protein
MGTLRFADIQTRPTEVLDLTSLTVEEFRELVLPFEAAFQAHMADGASMDGRVPPGGRRPLRTVPCLRPRIGCYLSSST